MLVRDFINQETVEQWAARQGLTGGFTVSLVQLDHLSGQDRQVGQQAFLKALLLDKEQERFMDFGSNKRRLEWLGGRIAAKHAAWQLMHGASEQVGWLDYAVAAQESGKPYLKAVQGQEMNTLPTISISHSGGYAVALAARTSCGIDIQHYGSSVLKVMGRFSTPAERSVLAESALPASAEESRGLTLLWSAKEAIRKVLDIIPLIGFMDMELVDIAALPAGQQAVQLAVRCGRPGFSDPDRSKVFQVMALLLEDFALALTITPE